MIPDIMTKWVKNKQPYHAINTNLTFSWESTFDDKNILMTRLFKKKRIK
jgi:hypothetical protein